jgi:putative hemolysin
LLTTVVVIGFLILANGFFAALEMAVVTARSTLLKTLADAGDQRAAQVLAVQNKPGDFLAMVQIGITLVATTAAAVGGAEVVRNLSPLLAEIQGLAPYADAIAFAIVVVVITYFTLVFGELVPKRLAWRDAENMAMVFTGLIGLLSRLTHIPMRMLSYSADVVLKLLGSNAVKRPSFSPEEIELLVKQGAAEGVFHPVEERLISSVFDYTDRLVQDVMTPRTSIAALDIETSPSLALRLAQRTGYSRFPVSQGDLDQVAGYVHIKDLIWAEHDESLHQCTREINFIPIDVSLPEAFALLTKSGAHLAIIMDEFGGTRGLLTLEDLLEEIVGEIEDEHSPIARQPEHHRNGEWIIPGNTMILDVEELLGVDLQQRGIYTTLAGFILMSLGKISEPGDQIETHGFVFTVKEMDRLRIVNIHVRRVGPQTTS